MSRYQHQKRMISIRFAILAGITLIVVLCGTCGNLVSRQQRQYARNRQLMVALEREDVGTARVLVNLGADPNTRLTSPPAPTFMSLLNQFLHRAPTSPNNSLTAFQIACGAVYEHHVGEYFVSSPLPENLPLVEAMLLHGANVHVQFPDKSTVLFPAIADHRLHTVEAVLRHGANSNAQNADGTTPLMRATDAEDRDMLLLLLAHGANPNAQSGVGTTALHRAVNMGDSPHIVVILLDHGANPRLRAKDGEDAIELAQNLHNDLLAGIMYWHGK